MIGRPENAAIRPRGVRSFTAMMASFESEDTPAIVAEAGRLEDASLEDSCVQAEKGDQHTIDTASASSCRSQPRFFASVLSELLEEDQRATATVVGRSEDTTITWESGHQPTNATATATATVTGRLEDSSIGIPAESGRQPTIAAVAGSVRTVETQDWPTTAAAANNLMALENGDPPSIAAVAVADTLIVETGDQPFIAAATSATSATLAATIVLENGDQPTFAAVADTIVLESGDRPTIAAVADFEDGEHSAVADTILLRNGDEYDTMCRLAFMTQPPPREPSPPRERSPCPRLALYMPPLYDEAEVQAKLARLDRMFNDQFPPFMHRRFLYSLLPADDSEDMDDWYAGCIAAAQTIIDRRERFYFGISGCLELRVQDHVCEYNRTMRVLVRTDSVRQVKRLERRLTKRFNGNALCENIRQGGGGNVRTAPFFLYVCNRPQ